VLLSAVCAPAWAQDADDRPGAWRVTPRISVGTTYSDNINLVPADAAQEDFVLQVDPGVSVRKRGGRLDLRLDYTAQGLMYANNSDANKINNFLQAFGTAELIRQNLFLDAYGSIEQVPIDSSGRTDVGGLGVGGGTSPGLGLFNNIDFGLPGAAELLGPTGIFGNIALTDNQATAHRFGLSPFWRQDLGGWAEALLRYRYDNIFYDEEDGTGDQPVERQTSLSDSRIHAVEARFASGRRFSTLGWNIDYFFQRQERDDEEGVDAAGEEDDRRENVVGQLNYRLNRSWSLLALAGYENSRVTDFEESRNGAYWALGAIWSPNPYLALRGLYGPDFNELALRWDPSARTLLEVSRRDQEVGVESGVRWAGTFRHRTRRTTWFASYLDEVTNNQRLFGSGLLAVGPDGQPLPLDEQGQVEVSEGLFGSSSRNFRRKRFDAGMTYRRGPTGFRVNVFNEDREEQDAASDESYSGVGALWTWRFAPRTVSFLGVGWEQDDLGEDQGNDYWVSVIGLARMFTPNSGGLISYRYYQNDAESADREFRENRLNLRYSLKF
jgi:uncharacterized protein (PEP-CTERM system associated)